MALIPNHRDLRERYDKICGQLRRGDRDRIRRALSWLDRAEKCDSLDYDDRFLFLWIAFSAAYGTTNRDQKTEGGGEWQLSAKFMTQIVDADSEDALRELVWPRISDSIQLLVKNQYIYQPFWQQKEGWEQRFHKQNKTLQRYYDNGKVAETFYQVLQRLHVLRNQIVHGGATWQSEVNRGQLENGTELMHRLVPVVLQIMLTRLEDNPKATWGDVPWPSAADAYTTVAAS